MSWCILVNTTPKYMQFAYVQIACIRRYADRLEQVPIYLATELTAENEYVKRALDLPNVFLLHLQDSETDFLESRIAAFQYLDEYKYILPLQDDFWLDRAPNYTLVDEAIKIMDSDLSVQSIRLMPCPGPHASDPKYQSQLSSGPWNVLGDNDPLMFTFQATLWRTKPYVIFLQTLIELNKPQFTAYKQLVSWSKYCISVNIAENKEGQAVFRRLSQGLHLSIEREGAHANAVYKAPWPYRPTAVVHGCLESWAKEFMEREGF